MRPTITASFALVLLIVVTTACSSPRVVEWRIVGEWQSAEPESVHFKIQNIGDYDGGYHAGFVYAQAGTTYAAGYWAIYNHKQGTCLHVSYPLGGVTGLGGDRLHDQSLCFKIYELTSDKLVIDWGIYPSPTKKLEFHRVK